jgi:Na+-driven multidrug efflux pump
MKKMLVGAFLGMFTLAWVAVLPNYANAQNDWAKPWADANMISDSKQKLTWSKLLDTIKNAINWMLWILATVALVICLYGWFKMMTAAGDEKKYGDGLKVLKYAAIWLAIIGLSWMIVSIIFWFVGTLWGDNQTKTTDSGSTSNVGNLVWSGS